MVSLVTVFPPPTEQDQQVNKLQSCAFWLRTSPSVIKQLRRTSTTRRLMDMWVANPLCYWCDVVTVFDLNRHKVHKGNAATIDHLKSRTMGRAHGETTTKVLSCHTCNQQRNDLELKTLAGKPVCKAWVAKFATRGGFDLKPTNLKP